MNEKEKISIKIRSMKKYVDFLTFDFTERFAKAGSLRNILVHMYEEVDREKLHNYLQTNLGDFDEFAKYIARYLEKEG